MNKSARRLRKFAIQNSLTRKGRCCRTRPGRDRSRSDIYVDDPNRHSAVSAAVAGATAPGAVLPVEEIKAGLSQEQERILSDQERLEALLRDLPQGDDYSLV